MKHTPNIIAAAALTLALVTFLGLLALADASNKKHAELAEEIAKLNDHADELFAMIQSTQKQ